MGGTAENRACTVSHQDKIRDPDGEGFTFNKGVFNFQSRIETEFRRRGDSFFSGADFGTFFPEVFNGRTVIRKPFRYLMIWRQGDEARPKKRVWTGRKNINSSLIV